MKKRVLKYLGVGLVLLSFAAAFILVRNQTDTQTVSSHIKAELPTIKPEWKGNAVDQKGRFINDEFPFLPKTIQLIQWQVGTNPFEQEKLNDPYKIGVRDPRPFLESDKDGILWLGHASFYIRLNGVGILTDPVFDTPSFFSRFVPVPSPLPLLSDVQFVLLSHDHRDHMDEATLRQIAEKFPNAAFLAGLRSEDVLAEWNPKNPVLTAGWFQEFETSKGLPGRNIKFYFHPVRHWSQRFLLDTNHRLWGGFVVETDKATIYFGGDSGYGRHYRELAELHPKIDYFLLGIGSYEPRWFMEPNHNNPSDALKAFQDSKATTLIPMHYGTFDLSDEPPGAPLRDLLQSAGSSGLRERIRPLEINESLIIK